MSSRSMRMTFVAVFACYIVGGPIAIQVLGLRGRILNAWQMYHAYGLRVCDVKYYLKSPTGTVLINRLGRLGYNENRPAPLDVKIIGDLSVAKDQAAKLCKGLPPRSDVRLYMRCPTLKDDGWRGLTSGEYNLCE
jgi:hypothetical protein